MTEEVEPSTPSPAKPTQWRRFGYRNTAYLVFLALLIPLGIALEASGPGGPDRGGGVGAAVMLGGIGSLLFFLANAVLLLIALIKHRSARIPLIACALPIAIVVFMLVLEALTVS
jgi:hypothetical protein